MKRGKGVFIGLLLLSTVASTSSWAGDITFSDILGHWGKPAIEEAVRKSYVDGFENGTFRPDQHVTRAEFIKMAVTALKMEVPAIAPGDNWYTSYNNAAVFAGIHQWRDFTDGDWNTPITRLEMARIALRASDAELQKPGVLLDEKSLMFKATSKGLIQGMDETGTLGLDEPTTRAQSVTIIERILKVKDGGTLPVDKHAVSRAEVLWRKTNIFSLMPEFFGGEQFYNYWDAENLFVETDDGKYRGELDALLAIDLEDPNDPFLSELPDIESLRWHNLVANSEGFPVSDYRESYIVLAKNHVEYNDDKTIYLNDVLAFSISGPKIPDMVAYQNGELNSIGSLYIDKIGDIQAYIIPKRGLKTRGQFTISIYAPAKPPANDYKNTLLRVDVPLEFN
ncbi:S-layer homology domain-containing protein [Paenibacillus contaminans]|uniref:S-layer homology domain-containing protein n=1 Tax=Paenibacillus contaminans TaxID=450362 RepID=UPI001314713D|nr:S-layer homology domain-containing protein [Paenibacillus contaminans]